MSYQRTWTGARAPLDLGQPPARRAWVVQRVAASRVRIKRVIRATGLPVHADTLTRDLGHLLRAAHQLRVLRGMGFPW